MMYDMTDVEVADLLAGGPRDDLDDVIIHEPAPVLEGAYMVPDNTDLLTFLQRRVEQNDMQQMLMAALRADFTDAETGERIEPEWDDVAARLQGLWDDCDQWGPRQITQAWNRVGEELYRRCTHLRAKQVHDIIVQWGYPRSVWAFWKHLERQGYSARDRDNEIRAAEAARRQEAACAAT